MASPSAGAPRPLQPDPCSLRRRDGKLQSEGAAETRAGALGVGAAAMLFGHRPHDKQAKSGALNASRHVARTAIKPFEDSLQLESRDLDALVRHPNRDLPRIHL